MSPIQNNANCTRIVSLLNHCLSICNKLIWGAIVDESTSQVSKRLARHLEATLKTCVLKVCFGVSINPYG